MIVESVLPAYGLHGETLKVEPYGSGLINKTWKVTDDDSQYILQKVNDNVFRQPGDIAFNIRFVSDYLKRNSTDYRFVAPIASSDGSDMVYLEGEGFFRLFPFVPGSHSKEVVETPEQAYEAAMQFGRFTRMLSSADVSQLKITIPFFHDLNFRFQQFSAALEIGNKERIRQSHLLIRSLYKHSGIVTDFEHIKSSPEFRLRVTHHDTKISNVLFDDHGKSICVIDLDTVMPGYFISDVGDMMRTYLSPVSEEEKDTSKIEVREAYYNAILEGYVGEMKDILSATEKKFFFYAGKFMIYMQALRFLTDHINDDKYYGARYPDHNFFRANNQVTLLECLLEKEAKLQ